MGTPDPRPQFLGVLVDDEMEQLIVEPRLAPARVASKRCRVIALDVAVRQIVERAEAEGRVIAGWSFFDRDVAMRGNAEVASRVEHLYRNVIQTARPWRVWVHPAVKIAGDGPFAPKHTLDKYAALSGYRHASALSGAEPAKWIQHTLQQLEAKAGRYRKITKQAKRDWYRVLEYNRHDCLATRHIAEKASRELGAWRAYQQTRFCVDDPPRRVCFRANTSSQALQALLARHDSPRFAFITAWNPGSVTLSQSENARRGRQLLQDAEAGKYPALHGAGEGEDENREPEESLMILGIPRGKAQALGRKYGQLAIVFGKRGERPQLVSCAAAGGE